MIRGSFIYAALLLATAASAADPPVPVRAQTPPPTVRKPLDLRIGDVRRYMTPDEFRANVTGARDEERNTVVVQARVPLLPMKSEQPVPGGIMSLWYAATNPTQAWRIFLPDPKQGPIGPPDSKVPPPEFRWGP
jgi:hypothetical protein